MRIKFTAVSLVAVLGFGVATVSVPIAPRPTPGAARAEGDVLSLRLAAAQPDWPERMPVVPPRRALDCLRLACVALTFDDGPGEYTETVLDVLAAHHARATFFLIGENITESTWRVLRRMASEGHELGNHTWDHSALDGLSAEGIRSQLGRTEAVVGKVTGVRMTLMRPPYGATDAAVEAEARRMGLAQILWAVDPLDWRDRDSALVVRRCGEAKPGQIVLMHDIHETTVDALPRLLDVLDSRGFTYVTVSELLGRPLPGHTYVDR